MLAAPGLEDVGAERRQVGSIAPARAGRPHGRQQAARPAAPAAPGRESPPSSSPSTATPWRALPTAFGPPRPSRCCTGGSISPRETRPSGSFTSGHARVLLATDAAAHGLNLHARCRLVVDVELPWTPARLEQRIGRVDRIGQRRLVHALNFVSRGTVEELILARLVVRVGRERAVLGPGDSPLGPYGKTRRRGPSSALRAIAFARLHARTIT